MVFDRDNLRKIVKEANIEYTDWPRIGECLGQDLRNAFVEGILAGIQLPECSVDKANLWNKVAQTLEGMEGCRQAANKAKNNAGRNYIINEIHRYYIHTSRQVGRSVFLDKVSFYRNGVDIVLKFVQNITFLAGLNLSCA